MKQMISKKNSISSSSDEESELKKNEIRYKELFENANDAIFFGEVDVDGIFKRFIDVNDRACKLLGYSKAEILKISPLDICGSQHYMENFSNYSDDNFTMNRSTFETKIFAKDENYIPAEVSLDVFELDGKKVFLTIARDITERKAAEEKIFHYSKLLEGVLEGIPDIIGVSEPDNTIMFYNQAGYDFFNKTLDEIENKKCYEMLFRKQKCSNCPIEKKFENKEIVRNEKYVRELDKYLDCCCTPVLDDSGEVIYIINQLRDITEKKSLENILMESEERYRQIVDLLPDAIIITIEGKIVLANKEACKYFENLVGQNLHMLLPNFKNIVDKRLKQIVVNKKTKTIFDYKTTLKDNRVVDVEVSSSYLNYQGKPAVLSILRDVTRRKKELNAAARIQKQLTQKFSPIPDKANFKTLYVPARTVSGDFMYLHKTNDNLLIGIIGDVSGKGISAALNISAFNVLFHEAALVSHDPMEIVNTLNRKVSKFVDNSFEDRYVAACCFSFDFKNNVAKIVGAGINQFIFKNSMERCERRIVKGPFLGMFKNSVFDEQIIHFKSGDRFYFFSDGLDFIFDDDKMNQIILDTSIEEFTRDLRDSLNEMLTHVEGIHDDCTLIAMKIK